MFNNSTQMALPALILHFDGVFNVELTLGKAKRSNQAEEEAYIETNLREPKRLKALLDSAHEKGYPIYLLAYVPNYIQSYYLQGIPLILKYLDKSLGVNRQYLTTGDIFSYNDEQTKHKFPQVFEKLITWAQQNLANVSFIYFSPFYGPGVLQIELQPQWGNAVVQSILVDDEGHYLDQLSDLVNFKQGFYNIDPTMVAAYHDVTKSVQALSQDLAKKERETNRRTLDRLLIDMERVFLGIPRLIFKDYKGNPTKYKNLEDVIKEYQTKFTQSAASERKKFEDFLAAHSIGSEESQFTTIYREKLDTLIKNYHIPGLNTFSQNALEEWCVQSMKKLGDLDDPLRQAIAYKLQKEREKQPIQQAIDERNQKRLALETAVSEKKMQYKQRTSSFVSYACIDGKLEEFRQLKREAAGLFSNVSEEAFINTLDTAIGMAPIHLACEFGHVTIINYLIDPERKDKHNCNLELKNNDQESGEGYPPLHNAVRANQQAVVELLLTTGC